MDGYILYLPNTYVKVLVRINGVVESWVCI